MRVKNEGEGRGVKHEGLERSAKGEGMVILF